MLIALEPIVQLLVGTAIIGTAGGLVRWGFKLDKSLGNTMKATELLAAKLNGHEVLDVARFDAATAAIERVERIALAQTVPAPYTCRCNVQPVKREGNS